MAIDANLYFFATKGSGSNDASRIADLLSELNPTEIPFDYSKKATSFSRIMSTVVKQRPNLIVMEGTGIAGGAALILCRFLYGTNYMVSSGDSIAPFLSRRWKLLYPLFWLYETVLYRKSAGIIAWTPYLVGRAITMGAKHAISAPGWINKTNIDTSASSRKRIRERLGLESTDIGIAIAGSIDWDSSAQYAYGLELVRAATKSKRSEIVVFIIGEGSGLSKLKQIADASKAVRIVFLGKKPHEETLETLGAMDLASLPQTCDPVGALRYTYKFVEYYELGLPIVTGELPLAYDLYLDGSWRLPGDSPWSRRYIEALTEFMDSVDHEEIEKKRNHISKADFFARNTQVDRVKNFVQERIRSFD